MTRPDTDLASLHKTVAQFTRLIIFDALGAFLLIE